MPSAAWKGSVGTSTATNSTILGVEHSKRVEKMTAAEARRARRTGGVRLWQ
jgi:hypothetical protein